jgi:hypothetical protein
MGYKFRAIVNSKALWPTTQTNELLYFHDYAITGDAFGYRNVQVFAIEIIDYIECSK